LKEYEILQDTGSCRKLVAEINRLAKEGWQVKPIGASVSVVYVLMEREISKPATM